MRHETKGIAREQGRRTAVALDYGAPFDGPESPCETFALKRIYVDARGSVCTCCQLSQYGGNGTEVVADLQVESLAEAHRKYVLRLRELRVAQQPPAVDCDVFDTLPCIRCARASGKLVWLAAYPASPWRSAAFAPPRCPMTRRLKLGLAATLVTLAAACTDNGVAPSPVTLYVANVNGNSITAYAAGANGNATPTVTIAGSNTGLDRPGAIALDGAGKIYVANPRLSTITVYAAGASGNATPTATIAGSNTGLSGPEGIVLDGAGNLFVANLLAPSITVYAAGASGNATPTATIAGSNTGLNSPAGIALDGAGKIYVTNYVTNSITVYAGASGNVTPTATIAGSNTGLNSPAGIALDGAGKIYVANNNSFNRITVYAAGASGNATPTATIAGSNTGLIEPAGIALDGAGTIYVANQGNNSITVYTAGANGNATPTATIAGSNTGLNEPIAIVFGGQNGLTPPPTATQLTFTVQPSNAAASAAITPAVQVTPQDAFGNTATGFTGMVTVAIGTNPGGGTLTGTTTVRLRVGW